MADATGQADIRAESFSIIVKGFALQQYKLMQLAMIESSSAETETYFREDAADLVGGTDQEVKGIPRLTKFPYGEVKWTKVQGVNLKHGMEGVISMEDIRLNHIPMITRTLLRIARAVTKSVDNEIASNILSEAGQTQAANDTWNSSTLANQDPIGDILKAKSLLSIQNYDPDRNGFLLLHPTNAAEMLGNANVRNAGQFYTDAVTKNGVIGRMIGLTIIISNSITEGGAQVVIAKQALTWKSVIGLSVHSIVDPGIDHTIRAFQMGQVQVTDTNAICKITGI